MFVNPFKEKSSRFSHVYESWVDKINAKDKLPRGKYFKFRVGGKGKPEKVIILDEVWRLYR